MNIKMTTLAALVATVYMSTGAAAAQTNSDTPLTTAVLRLSAPGVRTAVADRTSRDLLGPQWARTRTPAHERINRQVAGLILGGIGGFFAGGLIGSKVEPNCACDDPGLMGFIIG